MAMDVCHLSPQDPVSANSPPAAFPFPERVPLSSLPSLVTPQLSGPSHPPFRPWWLPRALTVPVPAGWWWHRLLPLYLPSRLFENVLPLQLLGAKHATAPIPERVARATAQAEQELGPCTPQRHESGERGYNQQASPPSGWWCTETLRVLPPQAGSNGGRSPGLRVDAPRGTCSRNLDPRREGPELARQARELDELGLRTGWRPGWTACTPSSASRTKVKIWPVHSRRPFQACLPLTWRQRERQPGESLHDSHRWNILEAVPLS